jgi:hypothetical protein
MFEGARKYLLLGASLLIALACVPSASAQAQPTPGQNVNMVSGTTWPFGDPFLERQNEPSLAVSTRNPLHLLAGANDYRTVDLNTLLESEPGEVSVCPTAGVTPCPPSAEPWVGQYISIDGGARWQSTLLPGYPQDGSAQGVASPLHGFTTAADPVIASGTNGMFYYGGIAFNRGSSQGLVFVARYMDLNNKENGDITQDSFPVRYIDTIAVAHGSSVPANFLDKPAIAVDIPRGSSTCTINVPQTGGPVQQTIPSGNVYVAYANVATSSSGNITSTIYFTRSTNCGHSWSTPQAISHGYNISQGATIQIDPETGIVYVAWRVIHSGIQQPNDGIAIAASLDGGNRFFGPLTLVSLPAFSLLTPRAPAFFDQGTTSTSIRTTAYPAMAVADSGIPFFPGPLYLAWSQRGMGPNGEARIMMLAIPGNGMFTSSGFKPPTPFAVDNGAITNDIGGTFPPLIGGFQLMPAMTFNQGKLMLIYYDLRQDHTEGEFTPSVLNGFFTPDGNGNFFEEARNQIADSGASPYFIDDAGLTVRRHTIDLVLAQSNAGLGVPTFTYSRVSRYDFGLFAGETADIFHQLKYDPPNLPMFMKGLGAFFGDYLGIAGQPFVLVKCGYSHCWTYNNPSPPGVAGTFFAAPKPAPSSPVHYATWTSNQDVVPPSDGHWETYVPITSGTSVYNGAPTQPCVLGTNNGHEGDRNQNVYSSRITQGLSITSPQTSKPLSSTVERGFVILVQNQTSGRSTASGFVNYFRLSIANQPTNGFASFAQLVPPSPVPPPPFPATNGNGIPFPQTSIDIAIGPHAGVARTLFAVSSNPTASILVNVTEMDSLGPASKVVPGGLSGFILLNADGTVPTTLVDPNGSTGTSNINNVELYDPSVQAPSVQAPSVQAPSVQAPSVQAPSVQAPPLAANGVQAPSVQAPSVQAAGVVATGVVAPSVQAPSVQATPPTDATYAVNTGSGVNTNTSLNVQLTGGTSTPLQLLVSQIYMTPQTDGKCNLVPQQQNITLANVPTATFTPVNQLGNTNVTAVPVTSPSFSIEPGGTVYITLRANVDIATMNQIITEVAPVVTPQAINSNDTTSTTPPVIAPLFIVTASLLNVITGQNYNQTLSAIGGTPRGGDCFGYSWSWSGAFDSGTPPGLTLSTNGVISGMPTAPGTYSVLVQVRDCAANTATRVLSIRVVAPLVITTAGPLATATQGASYGPVNFSASGGIGPYNWTPISVDGMTLDSSGLFSGTPTATGTFPFTATVSDTGPPSQSASSSMTLSVVPATGGPATGSLLCDNFNAAFVTQSANGPTNPTTCTLSNTTQVTQLATYHYNGGNGAAPGTITLQGPGGLTLGPFTATGVAGQGGLNEAWVATPNVIVPAGTYTVIDSGLDTWSFNLGSNYSGFVRLWGSAVRPANGDLIVADGPPGAATSRLLRIDPNGRNSNVIATISGRAIGVALDGSGNIYVAVANPATVLKVTPFGVQTTFAVGSSTQQFVAVAVDSSGNVYAGDNRNDEIDKFDPNGNLLGKFANTLSAPGQLQDLRMAFDAAGNLVVASDNEGSAPVAEIDRISPNGTEQVIYNTTTSSTTVAITSVGALAITPKGDYLVVAGGSIFDVTNPGTANMNVTLQVSGLGQNVTGLAILPTSANSVYDVLVNFAAQLVQVTLPSRAAVPLITGTPLTWPNDEVQFLPQGATPNTPTWTISLDAAGPVVSTLSGGEALAADLTASTVYIESHQDPGGTDPQFALIFPFRTAARILVDAPSMRDSDGSGIAVNPAPGDGTPQLIVADEAGNRIASVGYIIPLSCSPCLTSGTLFAIPWPMNPNGNGTGEQQYAPILTQAGTGPTHLLLYFWDNTQATLYSVEATAPTTFVPLLSLDTGTVSGMHTTTAGNHIAYDPNTKTLLLTDGVSNTVMEVNPANSPATTSTLFSNLLGTPTGIALSGDGTRVFVQIGNSIYVGARSGGSLSLVASGFSQLTSITTGNSTSGSGFSLFAVDKNQNAVFEIVNP